MFRGLRAFKKEFKDFAERIPRGGHAAIRRESSNWFSEVVRLTPKDSNFASSMWKTSINSRPPTGYFQKPKIGSFSPASTPSFYNLRGDDTLYIYNNVAYISRLENGWSSQAPANFFKNSARRADRRLQNAFDKIK